MLTTRERLLYNRLAQVFAPYLDSVAASILKNRDFDISALPNDLQSAIITELQEFYTEDSAAVQKRDGLPSYDPDIIASAAADWASRHTFNLVRGLTDTTNAIIQRTIATAQQTPGMTLDDMIRQLQPAFGKRRAESIAVTETTRAASAAVNGLQEYYKGYGLEYVRVWVTDADDLVCPICAPLNGKSEEYWRDRFPDGPPAHPNCRCFTILKLRR